MQRVQKSIFARWSTAKIAMLRYAIAIMSGKTHLGYWVPVNEWDEMVARDAATIARAGKGTGNE